MDFSLTEDQKLLQETAAQLLERECPPSLLRRYMEEPSAADSLWRHLASYAELGAGACTDACLFLEQTGYVSAPGPLLATMLFRALTGEEDSQVATVALVGDSMQPLVMEADRADVIAVVVEGTVSVIDANKISKRLVPTVDFSRRLFEADLPQLPGSSVDLNRWRDRAHTYVAAEMAGVARRLFDMSLQYAKDRRQFDTPIGSFQAIQHKLANMSLTLERAVAAVQYAAMTVDADDDDRTRACHVAKAAAGEAARQMVKEAIQIHGGIGYTWEHDLHLFMRRATADEYLFGMTGWHLDRIADLIFASF